MSVRPQADAVVPVYGERSEALAATLSACLKQTVPFAQIVVVDDGSPEPLALPEWARTLPQIVLLRLPQNSGISAARNFGIAHSTAPFVACINCEVLVDPDWLALCMDCLSKNETVGACFPRLVSATPNRLLTRWRMRFLEQHYHHPSGVADFAPGHAVLFRKEALAAVGGYDPYFRYHHEDSNVCHRMREAGWETYYMAEARCVSIQADGFSQITGKTLREDGWYSPRESALGRLYYYHSKWMLVRMGRNVVKGRFYFIPIDVGIWAYGLWMATVRTIREAPRANRRSGPPSPP